MYDVLGAPTTDAEEFLDHEVMCGLLGLDTGTTIANEVCTEEAVVDPLGFPPLPGEDVVQRGSEIAPLRPVDDFNQTANLLNPQSCLASPISNEDSAPDTKPVALQNRGNDYVFGIGNPASVNVPGVYEAAKLEPLRPIQKPRISRTQTNKKSQTGVCQANRTSRQNITQKGYENRANQDASVSEHVLYTPVAVTDGIYGSTPGLSEAHGASDHDFSGLPEEFLREGQDIIPPIPGNQQSQDTYTAGGESVTFSKSSMGAFNPLHFESNFVFPGPGSTNKVVESYASANLQAAHLPPDETQISSALSFMDMFRIDSIPIPHPGDWKSPSLLSGRPHRDGTKSIPQNQQSKRRVQSKPRVRKPAASKRKMDETEANLSSFALGSSSAQTNLGKHGGGKPGRNGNSKKCDDILMPTVAGVSTIAVQPSRFCHICLRRAGRVTLLACGNALEGSCRKVVCEKCFESFGWDWAAALKPNSMWTCTHCRQAYVSMPPS